MHLTFYETSHIGRRESNQDYYAHCIHDEYACFVIADGLGGYLHGDLASQYFCEAVVTDAPIFEKQIVDEPAIAISRLIRSAAKKMREKITERRGMVNAQTTFALAWVDKRQLICAHLGDSRFYRLDRTGVLWRSPDHTLVQVLLEEGKITEEQMGEHPFQNRLLKTVNLFETPAPEITLHSPLYIGETVLLCTDGFWSTLQASDLLQLGNTYSLNETIDEKIKNVLASNLSDLDNITIQAFRMQA